jgi:7-cyano-7-deazaguanine synthase in queuosine biosynthesis
MVDININVDAKRIAILYSGGADSTLLYYLVATYLIKQSKDTQLDLLIVDRYNKPLDKAINLYNTVKEKINDKTSNLKIITLLENTPGHLQVIKVVEQEQNNYDTIFWGVNQYPDDLTIRPKKDYTVNFSKFKNHPKLKLPFSDYKKTDIVETFIELGIEDILRSTHSCGRPGAEPCGECFNCRERIWAFNQLGLEPNLGI